MQCTFQVSLNTLIAMGLVVSLGLTGCEKKTTSPTPPATANSTPASTSSAVSNTVATSTPSVTAIAQSAATATVLLPASPVSASAATATKSASAPQAASGKNLITQPTATGTPEEVLKKSVNALVNGNAKEAASYYHIEGVNMAQVLAEQQPTFQKQLKHLDISPTQYNEDKSQAGIFGSMTLENSKTPKSVLYKFQKINGQWKIVG